ncbi:hypothetical protein GJ179_11640 [Salmonella enterica subsp. enterica]|nr:hypothetical protein [Salmonella enterica]EEI1253471.1 hypothetical protein [Salmonella enterica subsp. enterica]EEL2516758.1 hypothetical protein [Salmonella enterica]EEO4172613.1 hypothetical protein [Salmonella enterica subsp. enterica]EIO8741043.1 hypothetical protein [Salmonella enterica]
MRDIQQVLERLSACAVNYREDVVWSSIAAGFKVLIPDKVKSCPQCCNDSTIVICGCMSRLNKNNTDMYELLMNCSGRIVCDRNYDITHGPFTVS